MIMSKVVKDTMKACGFAKGIISKFAWTDWVKHKDLTSICEIRNRGLLNITQALKSLQRQVRFFVFLI
jgi:hypothetical protein